MVGMPLAVLVLHWPRLLTSALLTHRPAPLTEERPIPLAVVPGIHKMIMPPCSKGKEKEDHRGKENVQLHRQRRYRWGAGSNKDNVCEESRAGEQKEPNDKSDVGPLQRRIQRLRQLGLLNPTLYGHACNDRRPSLSNKKTAQPISGRYSAESLLVYRETFLRSRLLQFRHRNSIASATTRRARCPL